MNPRFSLQGQRVFVAGASGAIGAAAARVLHEAGAAVVLAARRVGRLEALAAAFSGRVATVPLDVADEASVEAAFDRAGPCDILVNAVGVAVSRPALQQAAADWDGVMAVNLRGTFLLARAAAARMVAAGRGGSIVNVASILGSRVISGVAPYAASKAGVIQLTRALALEWARHGIRVNALAPGYIATDINAGFFASEAGAAMVRRIPQRRLGTVDDLAGPLLLLASAAGAHMTGTVLTVDGGHSIGSL